MGPNFGMLKGRREGVSHRSWQDRQEIVSAIIAETGPRPLAYWQLSPSEEIFFRARAARTLAEVGRRTSAFKAYYALKMKQPFVRVLAITVGVIVISVTLAAYFYLAGKTAPSLAPLITACAAATFAAIGWAVAGWIAHRNAVRQNTTNIIFARFAQATFGDAMHRFHEEFGFAVSDRVTPQLMLNARARNADGIKAAESVNYLLNYYEFISAGVISGDLDAEIVRQNIRGVLCYYYDKCELHIHAANKKNPRAFEHLRKLRTHYREP